MLLATCLEKRRLYNIFGSGANHAIHAQFMAQASVFNDGHKIGLLQGAGTRFATWFYAMHRLLRLKRALKATIHGAAFESVAKNARVVLAVEDIEDEVFWKSIFCLLRAVFPALKALRYCDSNVPAMDKIFFLVKRADVAIENSSSMLNDEELFGCVDSSLVTGCGEELDEVFGERGVEYERYVLVLCMLFDLRKMLLKYIFVFQR